MTTNYVYRVYVEDGSCVYIGVTSSYKERMKAHAKYSAWFKDECVIIKDEYPSLDAAKDAEAALIRCFKPIHNKKNGRLFKRTENSFNSILKWWDSKRIEA